jgi:hypothetical protein
MAKKTKKLDVTALVGRTGAAANIALRSRKTHIDSRPAWMRTRSGRNERAIGEY